MSDAMTPDHPRWIEFYNKLSDRVHTSGCRMNTDKPQSRRVLSNMGMDVEASFAYFENHGGYCDCEVLMNVDAD